MLYTIASKNVLNNILLASSYKYIQRKSVYSQFTLLLLLLLRSVPARSFWKIPKAAADPLAKTDLSQRFARSKSIINIYLSISNDGESKSKFLYFELIDYGRASLKISNSSFRTQGSARWDSDKSRKKSFYSERRGKGRRRRATKIRKDLLPRAERGDARKRPKEKTTERRRRRRGKFRRRDDNTRFHILLDRRSIYLCLGIFVTGLISPQRVGVADLATKGLSIAPQVPVVQIQKRT